MTTTTSDHATQNTAENTAAYIDQRISAAQTALREAEEEQQRLREQQRQRDRDERIAHFREDFENYLDDPALQEALGVRFDADKPLSPNGYVTPYAAITIDGAGLRIYFTGATYRVVDPGGRDEYTRLLYEPHVTQLASGILLGIAAYRQREIDRKAIEAEEAKRRVEREAEKAARANETPAPEPPAEPSARPVARVIESDKYRHVIELGLDTGGAKIAVLHHAGAVELIEFAPRWATDEQGHPTADHFRLTQEQMELLVAAYTQQLAGAFDGASPNDDDGMPF